MTRVNLSDEELVGLSQHGDSEAFDIIVERYQKRVFAVAYGFVHDTDEARDLVQESFIRAYNSIKSFRGTARFYTWIYRITVNLCIDYLRKQGLSRSSIPPESLPETDPPPTPETVSARKETRQAVHEAINALPEDQRAVVILRELKGLSYKEIAEVVGASIGTVMSRLFYARKRLRELLKSYFQGEGHE